MRSKISLRWPLLAISAMGVLFFSMLIFFSIINLPSQDYYVQSSLNGNNQTSQNLIIDSPEQTIPPVLLIAKPIRLKIPKISVNADIEYVGLTPDGAMGAPNNPDEAAWFNLGPRPGEIGSAVVAGHYGIKDGKSSVFDNLYKLRKGDKIYVENEKSETAVFVVSGSKRYAPNDDASDVFGSGDGKSHLNLITCEGDWDKNIKSYSVRLVVFADKE